MRSYGFVRALIALLAGLVLVIWPEFIKTHIVIILGILILAIGVFTLVVYQLRRDKAERSFVLVFNSAVTMLFGLVLLIFPNFFAKLLVFVFGLCLLVAGVGDLVFLLGIRKRVSIPKWCFLGPTITSVLGVVMFFFPNAGGNLLFILFGITLLIYSVGVGLATFVVRKRTRYTGNGSRHLVEDVTAEEV